MAFFDIPEGTPEWHATRLKHIGGSEIGGLFQVQQDFGQSAYTLHMVKSGQIPAPPVDDSPGTRVWYGKRKEATIAVMGAELNGWTLRKGGYVTDDATPGMGCSLDFVITEPGAGEINMGFDGPGILQVKNIDFLMFYKEWTGGEPPFWILLQLQHEIACAGYGWGVILAEMGGNQLLAFRYAARPRIADEIRQRVTSFWQNVRDSKPPPVDGTKSTTDALRALYAPIPRTEALDMRFHNRFDAVAAQVVITTANRQASEEAERLAKNEMEEILAGATHAESQDFKVKVAVVQGSEPRPPKPGEMIGGRQGFRRLTVTEISAAAAKAKAA